MSRKSHKQTEDVGVSEPSDGVLQRVFLYLHLKTIHYPVEDEKISVEIELTHAKNTLTMLSDHYKMENIIYFDKFINGEKTTFSITINQDDITDVTTFSDMPLTLTLYENIILYQRESFESQGESIEENPEQLPTVVERRAMAQGYIDLMEFFLKTRCHSSCTVFLYPLPKSSHRLTCKMEWEIYSLHPLRKQLHFSNVIFLTLDSLYNMKDELMNECDDMRVHLSFVSTKPNENMEYEKVPICSYTGFSKQLIADQLLTHKWESLKNKQLDNEQCLGIMAESKVTIQKLFHDLLKNEHLNLDVENINPACDYALVCNSLHRFVLTDNMENILEDVLAHNQYCIAVELVHDKDPDVVLLKGVIDLSVFMFPQVSSCNFAIDMRPPGYNRATLSIETKHIPKKTKIKKGKRKDSMTSNMETAARSTITPVEENPKENTPFAIIRICLDKPITEPKQDMAYIPKSQVKYQKLSKCLRKLHPPNDICEEIYHDFDETILDLVEFLLRNGIKTIEDNRKFYCSQLGNMTNKMMRLIAVDFNERQLTKSNIEFMNLMTLVYKELMERVHKLLIKWNSTRGLDNFNTTKDADVQKTIISRMNIVKYTYEIGNFEMSQYVMNRLHSEFQNSPILSFYTFLYDVEREEFEAAKEYLEKPLNEKYSEGQLFINMMALYITSKQELNDVDLSKTAEENLISSLTTLCENNPKNINIWILLYCLYKKHNYLPGMEYCRWKYENLCNKPFPFLTPIPKSRWSIFMAHKIEFKSDKAKMYFNVVELFLKLGLYQFAEWVYDEIATEAMDVENYFMKRTFEIFLRKLDNNKFNMKNISMGKHLNSCNLKATLAQVNGNMEFAHSTPSEQASKHYSSIGDMKDLECYDPYSLGLLRYAYHMMEIKEYSKAKEAFTLCYGSEDGICVIAAIGKGKACYWLNDLQEAEMAFAHSTQLGLYLPNVWAFLALINLRRGENYNALECWKYARLNSNEDIHEEILYELNMINSSDINIYVDIPDQKKSI